VRRSLFSIDSLFLGHISGMDSFAVGLKIAQRLTEDRVFELIIEDRYSDNKLGIRSAFIKNRTSCYALEA